MTDLRGSRISDGSNWLWQLDWTAVTNEYNWMIGDWTYVMFDLSLDQPYFKSDDYLPRPDGPQRSPQHG